MKVDFFGLMKKPKEQVKPEEKEKRLMYDLKPYSGCDYHRITLPLRDCNPDYNLKNDVLVFNRIFTGGLEVIKMYKREGMKIVVDWDDFISLEPDHYLYDSFKSRGFTNTAIEFLKLADVVTVTTELLAAKLRPYHKNVVVIRNGLPFDELQFTKSLDKETSTPIVWAGGASHAKDLGLVKETFKSQLITIAGYESFQLVVKGSYQEICTLEWMKVSNNFPNANLFPATKDLASYMKAYDGHSFAIAPLVDNPFNMCKSNLKILEAGAKGLPIICSKVLPYYNPVDEDVVTYAASKFEWQEAIKKHLNDTIYREEKAEMLAEHVRLHYNLRDINELRRQVYESL